MANLDPDLYPKLTIRPGESRFGTEKKKHVGSATRQNNEYNFLPYIYSIHGGLRIATCYSPGKKNKRYVTQGLAASHLQYTKIWKQCQTSESFKIIHEKLHFLNGQSSEILIFYFTYVDGPRPEYELLLI